MKKFANLTIILLLLISVICLTVSCTEDVYEVSFNNGHSTDTSVVKVSKGEAVGEISAPTRDGYEFIEWQLNGLKYDFDTPITKNIVLTAKWIKLHSVSIISKGQTVYSEIMKDSAVIDAIHFNLIEDDYELEGFYTLNTDGAQVVFDTSNPVTNDLVIYAKWKAIYTVTLISDNVTINNEPVLDGNKVDKNNYALKKVGFYLNGFYTLDTNNEKIDFDLNTPIVANMRLYADWLELFDVTIMSDGKVAKTISNIIDGNYISAANIADITKTGFVAYGLYSLDANNTAIYFSFDTPITADLTLNIDWGTDGLTINEGVITKYTGRSTAVILPNFTTENNQCYPITTIGANVFEGTSVVSINLPITVTLIGNGAFKDSQLASIKLPSGITEIRENTFRNTQLTSITLPDNVKSIGNNAFRDCAQLQNVVFNNGLETIGSNAFADMGLTKVELPASITSIGIGAFSAYSTSGGGSIEKFVFAQDSKLTNVPTQFLYKQVKLTQIVLPVSVTTIDPNAFSLTGITDMVLHEGIKSINDSFANSTALLTIKLPNSLESLGKSTFRGCNSSLTIFVENKKQVCKDTFALDWNKPEEHTFLTYYYGRNVNVNLNGGLIDEAESISSIMLYEGIDGQIAPKIPTIENGTFTGYAIVNESGIDYVTNEYGYINTNSLHLITENITVIAQYSHKPTI